MRVGKKEGKLYGKPIYGLTVGFIAGLCTVYLVHIIFGSFRGNRYDCSTFEQRTSLDGMSNPSEQCSELSIHARQKVDAFEKGRKICLGCQHASFDVQLSCFQTLFEHSSKELPRACLS
mmetsp:Transcript_5977/g.9181  ORF Transcript_5977/g.9181 Transcript_5977/m.9181 type:complete len:119 (-) Transcript_5977:244-600(-)